MAVRKRTVPTKPKKKGGNGIEKGPSRADKRKVPDKFKDARELAKFNEDRKKRFGAK